MNNPDISIYKLNRSPLEKFIDLLKVGGTLSLVVVVYLVLLFVLA